MRTHRGQDGQNADCLKSKAELPLWRPGFFVGGMEVEMRTKRLFYRKVLFGTLVSFLIIFGSSHSFGYEWNKTFGGSGGDHGFSVQQTADGGFIIAGQTSSFGTREDVYLIKTDGSGNEQWSKVFGGIDWDAGYSVQQTADGGFVIAGDTYSWVPDFDVYLIYFKPDDQGLVYTAVTPCRIVDTRNSGGIINATAQRNFHVFGTGSTISSQGGTSVGCPSPLGEPLAAHVNMTAVDPTGKGNLQAFPVGAGPGAGLIINYNVIGTNLANAGTVKSITGGGPDITVTSRVYSVHAVIDVLGYYYPAP